MTYRDTQNQMINNFADRSKQARQARSELNRASLGDPVDHVRKVATAGTARNQLVNFSNELLAYEVCKSHGPELANDVREGLERVTTLLERQIAPGEDQINNRLDLLRRAVPFATAHRDDTGENPQTIVAELNRTQSGREAGLWSLRLRPPNNGAIPRHVRFTVTEAEQMVSGLKDLRTVLESRSNQLTTMFSDNHAHRDSIERAGGLQLGRGAAVGGNDAAGSAPTSRATSTTLDEESDQLPSLPHTPPGRTPGRGPSLRASPAESVQAESPDYALPSSPPLARSSLKRSAAFESIDRNMFPKRHRTDGSSFDIHADSLEQHSAADREAQRSSGFGPNEWRPAWDQENTNSLGPDLNLPAGRPALLEISDPTPPPERDRRRGGFGL